ncbi:hypothetical protein LQ327_19370 [Actinomycetospora endophytica]|uniref:Ribosomally synthesized peptide with SipW-like signal peptide n=1 Tax=Actinomycetospora endophytica TaxID=2291215 RepID=A0ABS8PB83_9PSEU|nr:hypothetical protein [Actinomycetospora endophytica]MCD2195533.1 hypothetical protein [Actinomycetospora endophytica]
MAKHRVTLGRRGIAALAAAGALVIGGATATMIGTGNADVLDALTAGTTTTTVLPDLAPFKADDNRGAGKAEVSDEYGAPTGGGKAALRLSTPGASDKVNYYTTEDAGTPLADWIPAAAYSAYQGEADQAQQFPSLQLVVDYNGAADGGFSTLTYEPVYNTGDSLTPGEWHRYQAGAGKWCSTRAIPGVITEDQRSCSNDGAKPLSDYIAADPDIIVNAVYVNQGSGNPGLESAVDLITTPSTTYDFELTKPVIVPPVTEPPTSPSTPTTHPGTPGEHGGGQWGGDGHSGDDHGHGGSWGDEDQGDDGHCGCRK